MKKETLKSRRLVLEQKGYSFKYVRGNVEVGGGYEVFHQRKLIGGGREVSLREAIELAESQTKITLEIRKYLLE